jgi:predicted ATPase/DNA-binding winged helix-turn-helix (wHTH) protein
MEIYFFLRDDGTWRAFQPGCLYPTISSPTRCREAIVFTCDDVEILPDQQRVLVSNKPFKLGSRAYEVLEVLADAHGQLVSKDEIMRRVWPDTVVEENNLHVHVSAIRKMLGPKASLLMVVPGRGYRLALEFRRRDDPSAAKTLSMPNTARSGLPLPKSHVFGRDAAIQEVALACGGASLVSLVGPGGIGKTTLAIEAARRLVNDIPDGIWFVELSKVIAPQFVAAAVADLLDPATTSGEPPLQRLLARLRGKCALVVLDNCEHVIEASAELAQAILIGAPMSRVMVTSREPLRLRGEVIYRVQPLDVPLQEESNTEVVKRSAVQLFLARARSIDRQFAADECSISLAGIICRRLDGLPLAIELAASRAATLGVRELVANLGDRFLILNGGYRTALPQHQTLRATFDWSYDLLSAKQQTVFRRLGIFPSTFGLDAATTVSTENGLDSADVLDAVCSLSEKSLLLSEFQGGSVQYRLLETSRAYALQKLADNGEQSATEQRFVSYVCRHMQHTMSTAADSDQTMFDELKTRLDDVRAALHLALSEDGDASLGAEFITIAAPFFFKLALCAEVRQRARFALDYLETSLGIQTGARSVALTV